MNPAKIAKLGKVAFSRSIEPLKRAWQYKHAIVGFDTEYDSKTRELLSIQLAYEDKTAFIPWPKGRRLTPTRLWREVVKLTGFDTEILLVTYFSIAELQFLPVADEAFDIREYAGSLDVSFAVDGGRTTLAVFDLARWFTKQGLAHAAKSFGLRKRRFNTRNVSRRCLDDPKFRRYAVHDAVLCLEILQRLRSAFIEETGIDPVVAKTPANCSAQVFRNNYCRTKLYCDNNRARLMAMQCTWGGRAEVFRRGKLRGIYREYDLDSAYPTSAIKLKRMPIQGSWRRVTDIRSLCGRRFIGGFAKVRFAFPAEERFPCLPVNHRGSMLFPRCGISYCTFAEIRVARACGADVRIIEAWGYSDGTPILADYMKDCIAKRQGTEGALNYMHKLLANSLVGKFAQRVTRVALSELIRAAERYNALLDEVVQLSRDEQRMLGIKESVSVGSVWMPEWNGLITGYTRAALAEMILSADDPVYCHTDSVWCRSEPECSLLDFSLKGRGRAVIVRSKFAGLFGRGDFEHIPHHSIWCKKTAKRLLAAFDGETRQVEYHKKRPVKLRESLRRGKIFGIWEDSKRTASTKWCGKRLLLPDGGTIPLEQISDE